MKRYFLGKLVEEQFIPDSFSTEKEGEFLPVKYTQYQIFDKGDVGDIVEDNTNYSCGEYSYMNRKWLLIQEIIPVL